MDTRKQHGETSFFAHDYVWDHKTFIQNCVCPPAVDGLGESQPGSAKEIGAISQHQRTWQLVRSSDQSQKSRRLHINLSSSHSPDSDGWSHVQRFNQFLFAGRWRPAHQWGRPCGLFHGWLQHCTLSSLRHHQTHNNIILDVVIVPFSRLFVFSSLMHVV